MCLTLVLRRRDHRQPVFLAYLIAELTQLPIGSLVAPVGVEVHIVHGIEDDVITLAVLAIGLKWDAIDFDQNTITIRHTVTSCDLDGKRVLVASDTTKTKSSMRTLPLVPFMRERLLTLKEEQQENRRLCGRSYIKDYLEYVCVNEIGDLIKPHYVTESFPKLLKAKGMRQIRYHDLRHSCASLLLANGVPMKQIQEWLGHSDFSTTANIYAHLDYSSKLTSADAMLNGLGFAQN